MPNLSDRARLAWLAWLLIGVIVAAPKPEEPEARGPLHCPAVPAATGQARPPFRPASAASSAFTATPHPTPHRGPGRGRARGTARQLAVQLRGAACSYLSLAAAPRLGELG